MATWKECWHEFIDMQPSEDHLNGMFCLVTGGSLLTKEKGIEISVTTRGTPSDKERALDAKFRELLNEWKKKKGLEETYIIEDDDDAWEIIDDDFPL